jgi:hypothetical protein
MATGVEKNRLECCLTAEAAVCFSVGFPGSHQYWWWVTRYWYYHQFWWVVISEAGATGTLRILTQTPLPKRSEHVIPFRLGALALFGRSERLQRSAVR